LFSVAQVNNEQAEINRLSGEQNATIFVVHTSASYSGDIWFELSWETVIFVSLLTVTVKKNSMVWVRQWTIPTEWPPLVGKVIANFLLIEGAKWSAYRSLRPYSRFSRQELLLFYQVAPQLCSRGWVDPIPDPLLFFSGSAGNRTRASRRTLTTRPQRRSTVTV
jgi:hypothetical protein